MSDNGIPLAKPRFGGRSKGTPNRATAEVKAFLDRVFKRCFADPEFESNLVKAITKMEIDPAALRLLMAYYAGVPTKPLERQPGAATLEQIVAGTAPLMDAHEHEGDEDGRVH